MIAIQKHYMASKGKKVRLEQGENKNTTFKILKENTTRDFIPN